MTAAMASPARDRGEGTIRRAFHGFGGLGRVVLRQHRVTVWAALAVTAVLAVALVWLRFAITDFQAHHELVDPCAGASGCEPPDAVLSRFRDDYSEPLHYIGRFIELLPLGVGLFVAGPMIARELESGTYKLAWTQSVSPVRWFVAKLALPAVAVLAGVSLLSALHTWAWRALPVDALPGQWWFRSYSMIGPVPVARCLLALALGALAGLLAKRTVPAMALALLGCLTVVAQLDAVRQKLITPATDLTVAQPGLIRSGQDWILERGLIDPSGTRLPEPDCGIGVSPQACASRHGATGWYLDYHPASHLWPLQWAEAGITVGAAALAAGAALWLMRRAHP
ncbi:hypothetical protein FHS39_000988 [Streptomyces olivoverticillatus]|uniref:Transmembrane transport protein n=1 Tax=Streptomyces olivoverticillatus TaxID=66427 RepID=A0A7W7LLQ3_9ACTN|nr:transporter [Streptomyces olivoverticillatus]MBB4891988.1 hypothetical protein [Streptomyces olivoverticillatus]